MPLHKNALRQKRFTFVFIGTYLRQSNADSTSYLGIVQDFVTGVTDLSIDADVLPLTFGGVAGGTERVDNSQGNLDRWVINCMNHADDNHEYDAEDLRNSALAALNNVDWHDYSSGEDFEPNQLGSWQAEDEGNGRYDLAWIPAAENTAAFADDHPVGINQQRTVYLNVQDNFTPTEFTTDFSPITATLDEAANTVTLTASSASNMGSNIYWAVGRHFGINDNGTEIPQWIGTVTSRTTENDGSFTIVLNTDTTAGLVYLVDKVAGFVAGGGTENNVLQLFTTGRHFVVLEHSLYLYMVDQVTTANLGYFFEGSWTEEDLYGDVIDGFTTATYNSLIVNLTSIDATANNDFRIRTIPAGTVSTTSSVGTEIRLFNFATESTAVTGSSTLFVRIPPSVEDTPLAYLTSAAASLTAHTGNGVSLTCTVSGTTNDATMVCVPRDTTLSFAGATEDFSDWTGAVSTGTIVIDTPTLLSLANDTNREGDKTGVTFINNDWVEANDIQFLDFGRGSTGDLSKGFKLLFNKGYSGNFDGKDVTINGKDIELAFTYNERGNLWDAKTLTSGVQTVLATEDNPFTLNLLDSSLTFSHINMDGGSNLTNNERTFVIGSAGGFTSNNHIFNFENVIIGFYDLNTIAIAYSTLGFKKNVTEILNTTNGALLNAPSTLTPTLTGVRTVVDCDISLYRDSGNSIGTTNTQAFARDFNSLLFRINAKLEGTGVVAGTKLTGYNPQSVNFGYINYLVGGNPYLGPTGTIGEIIHTWSNRGANGAGTMQYGVLYNPSYESEGEDGPLTNIYEEIYYGDETNAVLIPVKEGAERNAIGTIGEQLHPFVSGVTTSDTLGLADARINSAGVNTYSAGDAFIDATANYSGLVLIYARGAVDSISPSTDPTNDENNITLHATNCFTRRKRPGHRRTFHHIGFGDNFDTLEGTVLMRKDKYWQADTVAAIDAYVTTFNTLAWTIGPPSYDSGTTRLTVNIPVTTTWNELYRFIEYAEDANLIINANLISETRSFDIINGRFRTFIDNDNPVTTDGDMSIGYNLEVELNGSISRSTGSNSIRGIDVGLANDLTFKSTSAGAYTISGDFKADSFTFTETDGSINANNSVFNNTNENITQNYTIALANTTISSSADCRLSDITDNIIVNMGESSSLFVDRATTDIVVQGQANVFISSNGSTAGRFGTLSDVLNTMSYVASGFSTNDIAYAGGTINLPNTVTNGFFNSTFFAIDKSGTSGIWTNCDLEASTNITGNVFSGGRAKCGGNFSSSSLNSTTIEATGNVTISADATGSTGIGIIGNVISVAGNTDSCKISAVTTFTTNNITGDSNVTAGTSVTAKEIDDSTIVSPIVVCDYIQNEANVDATTSIDVDVSMTSGTADSATINIDVDLTGGTATASGTLTVPLISGAQTTANAGTLVATTVSSGFINFSGNGSTVTNINGGIFGGTGNLTTTSRITGGSFGTNITLLSVPTNTSTTRHTGNYSDTEIEVTNSGIVEWDNSASGVATLTKGPASGTVVVRPGGVSMTIATDDGSNNTDNITLSELPFTVNITSPAGTYYRVKYGNTITAVQTGTLQLDEASLDRDEAVEIAAVRQGYAMVYQTFTVENLSEGGVQNVLINTNTVEAYPEADISGITTNGYVWDSDNQWVIFDFADIPQDNLAMNRIMTQLMSSNSATAGTTLDAILVHQDASWYRSGGVASGQFIDPTKIKVTSSTASGVGSKETYPFYDIIGSTTDIYELTDLDVPLGQNTLRPGLSAQEVVDGLATRIGTTLNGIADGVENASLLIPADDITPVDL